MARAIEWSPVAKRNGYPYQSLNTRQLSFDAQKLQTMEASYQLREMEPLSGVIQKLVTNHDLPKPDEASKAFIPWIASSWMPLFIKANSSL